MTLLVLPGLVAVVASIAAALTHRRLRPSTAAPMLAAVSFASALAVFWSLILLAIGFMAHVAWFADLHTWCSTIGVGHDAVPPVAGVVALGLLAAMTASVL